MSWKGKPLSDLINENHKLAAILHQFGIDFIEHLNKTLDEACKVAEVNVDQLSDHISREQILAEEEKNCQRLSPGSLVKYLKSTHHLYAQVMLPIIQHHVDRLAESYSKEYPQLLLLSNIFDTFKKDFLEHIHYENTVVFPYITKLEKYTIRFSNAALLDLKDDSISNFILKHAHDDDEMLMLRKLTRNYKAEEDDVLPYKVLMEELKDFEEDLKKHSNIEETILMPKAQHMEERLMKRIEALIKSN